MLHDITLKVLAEVVEYHSVSQETGETFIDGEYSAEQHTKSEVYECTCGRRFYKWESAKAHLMAVTNKFKADWQRSK